MSTECALRTRRLRLRIAAISRHLWLPKRRLYQYAIRLQPVFTLSPTRARNCMTQRDRQILTWVTFILYAAAATAVIGGAAGLFHNANEKLLIHISTVSLAPGFAAIFLAFRNNQKHPAPLTISSPEVDGNRSWWETMPAVTLLDALPIPCYIHIRDPIAIVYANQSWFDFVGIEPSLPMRLSLAEFLKKIESSFPEGLRNDYLHEQALRRKLHDQEKQLSEVRYLIDRREQGGRYPGYYSMIIHRAVCNWMRDGDDRMTSLTIYSLRTIPDESEFRRQIEIDRAEMPNRIAGLEKRLPKPKR